MSAVIFNGNTVMALAPGLQLGEGATIYSGTIDPSSVATAGNAGDVYISTGASVQMYQKQDNGITTNWAMIDTGNDISQLTGDVSATGPGSVVATVNSVGGSTASDINSAELLANAATNINTPGAIVKRDADGNALVNDIVENISIYIPAGLDINLTAASSPYIYITGTGTQVIVLPDATTLVVGKKFTILNRSNQQNTVSAYGGATFISNIPTLRDMVFTLIANDNSDGTWDVSPNLRTVGTLDLTVPSSNGLTILGSSIYAQSASISNPGLVNTGNQTFAGNKTFSSTIVADIAGTAANISGVAAIVNGGTNSNTPLNNNRNIISSGGSIIEQAAQTANRAVITDVNGLPISSSVTSTTLGFLDATSSIQTQINGKQASGNYITALTGDVVAAGPGSVAGTIQSNVVTNAKAAQMAANTIKGNNTGGTANALDLTTTQTTAMLSNFVGDSGAGGTKGLVPAPASGDGAAVKLLRADGTWGFPKSNYLFVTLTNTFSIPSVSFTTVKFDTIVSDTASAYSTSTGIYTIPATGYYAISVNILIDRNIPLNTFLYLRVQPTSPVVSIIFNNVRPNITQSTTCSTGSGIFRFTKNDSMVLSLYQNDVSARNIGIDGQEFNFMTIYQVGD